MLNMLLPKEFAKELAALSTLFGAAYIWFVIGTVVTG